MLETVEIYGLKELILSSYIGGNPMICYIYIYIYTPIMITQFKGKISELGKPY